MAQERDEWYQACVAGMESRVESRLGEERKRRTILQASYSTTRSTIWCAQCNRSFQENW